MDEEYKLTEGQQRFFDEKKELVCNLPDDATDREKELESEINQLKTR